MSFKAITLADITKGRKSIEKERESRSEHWHTLKLDREELQAKEAEEEGEVTRDETHGTWMSMQERKCAAKWWEKWDQKELCRFGF